MLMDKTAIMVSWSGKIVSMNVNPKNRGSDCLGILMLNTCFPRPLGDMGNPQSFVVPVLPWVVTNAVPAAVVRSASALATSPVWAEFLSAAQSLAGRGVWAITSSCGFLVLMQSALQAAVPDVPVRTSSLLQLPALLAQHEQVGVLTINASALGADHLLAAGVSTPRLADVLVQGIEPCSEFVQKIMGNRLTLDLGEAQRNVVAAAVALKQKAPHLTQLVLECTNMPPYQHAIELATGLLCKSLRDDPVLCALAQAQCGEPLATALNYLL
jgi:hypothetical protein